MNAISGKTRTLRRLLTGLAVVLSQACSLHAHAAQPPSPDAILFQDGSASETLVRALVEAFNKSRSAAHISLAPVDAETASDALLSGKADLTHAAGRLSLADRKLGLHEMVIAREAVAFATGEGAGIDGLSTRQLALIFSGAVHRWERAGGTTGPIRVLYREESDPLLQVMRRTLVPFAALRLSTGGKMVIRDQDMIHLMRKFRLAIGWGALSRIRTANPLRVLALDGVMPGAQTLASGQYPLFYNVMLILRRPPEGTTAAFVQFVFSEEGRSVIKGLGALEVARQ